MQIFETSKRIGLQNTAVTLGKFDGMHLGHQSLILELMKEKEEKQFSTVVFSFDIVSANGAGSLTTKRERAYLADKLGVDYLVLFPANTETMQMEPERFIQDVLIQSLGAKVVVTGRDFRFGRNRAGTVDTLKQYSKQYGYSVIVKDDCIYEKNRISSSRIKQELEMGNLEYAKQLLGYSYFMMGNIVKGKQLGRTMGLRTLNMEIEHGKRMLPKGVYVTETEIDGCKYKSITNIGTCPTVSEGAAITVETHVLDFEQDIYGEEVLVKFYKYIREERKFSGIDELKEQIMRDINFTKKYFHNLTYNNPML